MKNKIILAVMPILAVVLLASCRQTDIIGNTSIKSFNSVLDAVSDKVTADEMNGGWSLTAPDGTAKFIWSRDYSKSPTHDIMIEFDAQPFIDAGLNISKLPSGMAYEDKIMAGTKLGTDKLTYDGEATPISSFEQIVRLKRGQINYHSDLDHFGVLLGDGNMFEWVKDMSNNDKDIVFVLNPQVFINAGVDPEKVDGWKFAKVKTMDENGKPMEVDKFLKPFNIK